MHGTYSMSYTRTDALYTIIFTHNSNIIHTCSKNAHNNWILNYEHRPNEYANAIIMPLIDCGV